PSKVSPTVFEPRRPSLSSGLPTCSPLAPPSTRKQLNPLLPSLEVRAHTTSTPAYWPEVIHCLAPSSTQPLPARVAVVFSAPASEPACGSDKANAPATAFPEVSAVTCFCFWASVPKA